MNELSMKSDKKLPNLKVPVKGKKGVSKFMRKKLASTAKDDLNASVQSADRKPEKYMKPDGKMGIRMVKVDKEVIKKESVNEKKIGGYDIDNHISIRRGSKYHKTVDNIFTKKSDAQAFAKKHDGFIVPQARGRFLVGLNKVTESIDNHPKVKAARKAHAAGTWDGNVDKEGEAVVHINGKPHTVTNRYGPKKQSNPDRFKPFKKKKNEAINHDDAHRDAQTHSDGSMSVKKIPSMIKKSGDKHLHLHMKSYHKEKDGQDFAKKHGYKVKNYVKTPSGTRMDIHKEMVDPMDLRGRPKKRDPYPKSPYGLKHPLHPVNIAKKKAKETEKNKKESVDEAIKNLSSADQVKAAIKIIRDKRFNMRSQIDKKTAIQKISKDLLKDPKVKKEMDKIYEESVEEAKTFKYFNTRDDAHAHAKKHGGKGFVNTGKGNTKVKGKRINTHVVIKKEEVDVDEALTMQQRIKKRRDMKRNKARIAIGRRRAKKKMANMKVIKKRSDRQARNAIAKKLTRGISKRDLTPARKKEIEKRLESPALKMRIKRLSKRMFKDVRKKEVMRKKG